MSNQQPKLLTLKELFTWKYIIPIYQRDYAWTEKEINQMLEDIFSVMEGKDNYYIGTLIVYPRKNSNQVVYETIDGQQRVTTLMILMTYLLNNKELNEILKNQSYLINSFDLIQYLEFDSRERSTKSLKALAENEVNDATDNITEAYNIIDKYLSKKTAEDKTLFINYLLNSVKILRVEVPEDTDLNHYFEIMNSRGEQLEKHEILKSRLLSCLKEEKSAYQLFANIWEACSNLERYVQYGFHSDIRQQIFGKYWNQLLPQSFDDIVQRIGDKINLVQDESLEDEKATISIASILENPSNYIKEDEKGKVSEKPDRFNPVINFPNFLLIVLKIMTNDSSIGLDDKFLLSKNTFEKYLNNAEKVKEFGFLLLKTKFLFDKFVIKREYFENKDQWSLKKLYYYQSSKSASYINVVSNSDNNENNELNKQLVMIQSMFHVSNPSQTYKNWLLALLGYLNTVEIQEDFQTGQKLYQYLEKLAKYFMVCRYLSPTKMEFDEVIAKSMLDLTLDVSHIDIGNLNKGTQVDNFIFNYLDFILYRDKSYKEILDKSCSDESITKKIESFEFTFRSSVEHYYPQTPFENHDKLDTEILNSFGNLCLLSSSLNSRLNNFSPEAKKDHFKASNIAESIKQSIMMSYPNWTKNEIIQHGADMIKLIKSSLDIKTT